MSKLENEIQFLKENVGELYRLQQLFGVERATAKPKDHYVFEQKDLSGFQIVDTDQIVDLEESIQQPYKSKVPANIRKALLNPDKYSRSVVEEDDGDYDFESDFRAVIDPREIRKLSGFSIFRVKKIDDF